MQTKNHQFIASALLRGGMETTLLLMVVIAPWAFGAVHPFAQLLLHAGLVLIMVLWALRIAVEGALLWKPCAVSTGLAALCVLAIVQIVPWPDAILRTVSPGTTDLYDEMRPSTPESIQALDVDPLPNPLFSTVSVSPHSTTKVFIQLLAALAVFAAIRTNLTSSATLYRVSIVVVLNGALLSLIGLAQFFSSPHNVVLWIFPTEGQVFGTFICRNHFAYFINLSLGLGVGLLLHKRQSATTSKKAAQSLVGFTQSLLLQPVVLWNASALAIMGAALLCSLSRGGVLAFSVAVAVCVLLNLWRTERAPQHRYGLLLTALLVVGIFWLCSDYAGNRLYTIWQSDLFEEGRRPVWSRVSALVPQFPLLGTGLGTFRFVEPLTRLATDPYGLVHDHVHNDYLELLIEGGLINLGICLTIIYIVFSGGIRVLKMNRGSGDAGLILGCLFGLTAVLVHSTVDFGMHIPAVALLVVVMAALMLNQDRESDRSITSASPFPILGEYTPVVLGIFTLLGVALFLMDSAWCCERAERFRLAARHIPEFDPERDNKSIAYMESALAYTPKNSLLQVSLAEAFRRRSFAQDPNRDASSGNDLALAAHHHLVARSGCPLLVQPHLFLAAHPDVFSTTDRPRKYLERACRLDSSNPRTWYVAGLHELQSGRSLRCWDDWKQSLKCGTACLREILLGAQKHLSPEELLAKLFPADPVVLFEIIQELEKADSSKLDVSVIAVSALAILEKDTLINRKRNLLRARLQTRTNDLSAARASYQDAIEQELGRFELRLELSQFLVQTGQLSEARKELIALKSLQPENREARSLYDIVNHKLAE